MSDHSVAIDNAISITGPLAILVQLLSIRLGNDVGHNGVVDLIRGHEVDDIRVKIGGRGVDLLGDAISRNRRDGGERAHLILRIILDSRTGPGGNEAKL